MQVFYISTSKAKPLWGCLPAMLYLLAGATDASVIQIYKIFSRSQNKKIRGDK